MIEITTITFTKEDRNFICELYPFPRNNSCNIVIYEKQISWWRETKKYLCNKTFWTNEYASLTEGAEHILDRYLADENQEKKKIAKWAKKYEEKKKCKL